MSLDKVFSILKGGAGSGNFDHAGGSGGPGNPGGSAPKGGNSGMSPGEERILDFTIQTKVGGGPPKLSKDREGRVIASLPGIEARLIYHPDGSRNYEFMSSVSSQKGRGRGHRVEYTDFDKFKRDLSNKKWVDPKDIDKLNSIAEAELDNS